MTTAHVYTISAERDCLHEDWWTGNVLEDGEPIVSVYGQPSELDALRAAEWYRKGWAGERQEHRGYVRVDGELGDEPNRQAVARVGADGCVEHEQVAPLQVGRHAPEQALEGVDALGLDELDRTYLRTIAQVYQGGPVGLEAIAATLNEDSGTLEDVVEPYLLQLGFLARTRQGRRLTTKAASHLGVSLPSPSPDTDGLFEQSAG